MLDTYHTAGFGMFGKFILQTLQRQRVLLNAKAPNQAFIDCTSTQIAALHDNAIGILH